MGYIKVNKQLVDDPRLLALARILAARPESGCSDPHVWHKALIGIVVTLWTFGDRYAESDDKLPIRPENLEDILRTPEWVVRLLPGDWLRINDDDKTVYLPGYCARNGIDGHDRRKEKIVLQRARWRRNQARRRAKKSSNGHGDDTPVTGRDKNGDQPGDAKVLPVPVPGPNTGPVPVPGDTASDGGLTGPPPPPKSDPEEARRKLRALSATLKANPKGAKP